MRRLVPAFAAMLVSAPAAFAADNPLARGIDTVPFKVTPTMGAGLTIDGADMAEPHTWQLGALLDVNVGVMGMKLGTQRLGDLLPFRADVHVLGAYQLHPRIEVSADLPVTVFQASNFQLLNDQGFRVDAPHTAGLGDPRLLARFQLLRVSEFPIANVAAIAEVRLPIGDGFSFIADRGFVFAPRLAAERRLGPFRVLANAGWRLRTEPGRFLNLYVGQEFTLGGAAELDFPDFWKLRQPHVIAELNLSTPAEAPFTIRDAEALKTPAELVLGGRAVLSDRLALSGGVAKGLGLAGTYGREALRVFAAVSWVQAPPEPDTDGDGVPDSIDQCPGQAEVKNGYMEGDGCTDEVPLLDGDNDGVPDNVDACPTQAGPIELDGCPDRDGDQLADGSDQCPDQPGPPELGGCPPPEEEAPVVLESERIRINNQILFTLGKAIIDPVSFGILNGVVKVLKDNPEVGPVLIEGHTDASGPAAFNLELSRKRAAAVEDYLVSKGVNRKRLRSTGYGFSRPIAPNDTPVGRAKNRRTEFRLVDADEAAALESKDKDGGKAGGKPDPEPAKPAPNGAKPEAPKPGATPTGKTDAARPGASPTAAPKPEATPAGAKTDSAKPGSPPKPVATPAGAKTDAAKPGAAPPVAPKPAPAAAPAAKPAAPGKPDAGH